MRGRYARHIDVAIAPRCRWTTGQTLPDPALTSRSYFFDRRPLKNSPGSTWTAVASRTSVVAVGFTRPLSTSEM